jgi:AraC-like DNA-binding protein
MEYFIYSKEEHRLMGLEFIKEFPFIKAFGHEKNLGIRSTSLPLHYNNGIEICYVTKGRYEWKVEDNLYSLLPGDGFLTCPWQYHGSERGIFEIGEIWWIIITPKIFNKKGKFRLTNSSGFSKEQENIIGKTLANNNHPVLYKSKILKKHFSSLFYELKMREFGYDLKVRHFIEIILLTIVRLIHKQEKQEVDNSKLIANLEELLISKLDYQWSVKEMAELNQMGTTSFNEKVKKLTGYTPSSFLIQLRIKKAKIKLLDCNCKITKIAYDCGFSSSQHFSTTFRQRTGESPAKFRERNCKNK